MKSKPTSSAAHPQAAVPQVAVPQVASAQPGDTVHQSGNQITTQSAAPAQGDAQSALATKPVTVDKLGGNRTEPPSNLSWAMKLPEWALLSVLAGLSVLLVYQSWHLFERPHFQFFPIAWLAFAWLIYTRVDGIESARNRWRIRLGHMMVVLGLFSAVAAGSGFSPWLGELAAFACITGWGLLRLNSVPALRWLGWTGLLWITLPLPHQMDINFINSLQQISSQSAGALLDLLGIFHLQQGNLIEIRTGKLFVDEACSGVDSLYSLMAIALLMMLWQGRPLLIGLLTLVCVPAFAWLGNVLRLMTIVVLLDQFDVDWSKGTPHTILGLCTFAISAIFLFVTLNAFAKLFQRFSSGAVPRDDRTWHEFYNYVVCFPGVAPQLANEEDNYFETSTPKPKKKVTVAPVAVKELSLSNWSGKLQLGSVAVASLLTIGLSAYHFVNAQDGSTELSLPHFEKQKVDKAFAKANMPEKIDAAAQVDFQPIHRPRDSFHGEYSRTWLYRHPVTDAQLSIDFPFRGFHPLWMCYTGAGSTVAERPEMLALPNDPQPDRKFITCMKLRDELAQPSYVWFALFDANGNLVEPGLYEADARTRIVDRIKGMFIASVRSAEPVTYQYQLYIPCGRELSSSEKAEFFNLYVNGLQYAVKQVQELNRQ